jgi:phage baseplate assembly protein W
VAAVQQVVVRWHKYNMSSLEKDLYQHIKISSPKRDETQVISGAYKGISTVSGTSKQFKLYDLGLIKQDIINHFHIRLGEKLENPTFGTIIWDVLYEPLTDTLRDAIVRNVTEIINYDPRVDVVAVAVDSYESGIQIECELKYLDYSISEQITFKFDRENNIVS